MANSKNSRKTSNCIDEIGGIYCNICKCTQQKKFNFDRHYKTHKVESDIIVYTCLECFKEIPAYSSFRQHCYQHTLKKKTICHHCQRSFSKTQALVDHLKNIHRLCTFICPAPCNQTFNHVKDFENHTEKHKSDKAKQCQTCKIDLTDLNAAEEHIDHHTEHVYFCPICNTQFPNKDAVPGHLRTHFENETLDPQDIHENDDSNIMRNPISVGCNICKITFKNKQDFETHHSKEHKDRKVYSCSICWKNFIDYTMFSNHSYNHIVKGKFKCDMCNKSFCRLQMLVLHMETLHNRSDPGKAFPCMECEMEFSSGKGLKSHLLDSHGISYQICPHPGCGKIFASPTALVFHQVEHRESPDKRCHSCGLPFKSLLACFRHMSVHKQIKFSCPVCSRKYSARVLALKHIEQHYQAPMHVCTECGKAYHLKSRLLEHMKTHKESNTCTYCNKNFPSKATLNDHINVHTKQTPYECWVCHKRFSAASSWRKHMKNIHNKSTKKSDMQLAGDITNNLTNNYQQTNTEPNRPSNEIDGKNNNTENNNFFDIYSDETDKYLNKKRKNTLNINETLRGFEIDHNLTTDFGSNDNIIMKESFLNTNEPFENNNSYSNEEINNIENINTNDLNDNYSLVNGQVIINNNSFYRDSQTNGFKSLVDIFNRNGEDFENNIVPNEQIVHELQVYGSHFVKESENQFQNINFNNFEKNKDELTMMMQDNFADINTDLTMEDAVNIDINNLIEANSDINDCEHSAETPIDEDQNIIMEIGALTEDLILNPPKPPPSALPLDYGPDFVSNSSLHTYEYGNSVVYLNESMCPHVDPRLTTKPMQVDYNQPVTYLQDMGYNNQQIVNPLGYQTFQPFTEFVGQYNVINPAI